MSKGVERIMMGPGYGYMMGGYGWIGTLLMFAFGALVIAGIVVLVVWAVRSVGDHSERGEGSRHAATDTPDAAIAIARRRLASGEITGEQYDEIMRTLGSR